MRFSVIALFAATALLIVANAAAQCASNYPGLTTYRHDTDGDFNDYGRIHVDAEDPNCAQTAMYQLTAKAAAELADPAGFTNWLDGYMVGEIFGAAMRIGANGWANKDLDAQLCEVANRFVHYTGPPPSGACGGDNLNTCMDDFAGTAAGYAWIAAYERRRVPHCQYFPTQAEVDAKLNLANQFLDQALGNVTSSSDTSHGVCIRRLPLTGSQFPLCTGSIADLDSTVTPAQTFSVNGQQQMIHYGFGLMTTVAFAKLGIQEAGGSSTFSADQIRVARALMEEAQRHITVDAFDNGTYNTMDCLQPDGNGNLTGGSDCGRGYAPDMLNLKPAYDRYFNGITSAGDYKSDHFNIGLFFTGNPHFDYGRYVAYGIEGNTWISSEPTMMPGDALDPIGFLDNVSPSGVATGWSCDQDFGAGSVQVDFYDESTWTYAGSVRANLASEQAVNSWCGGTGTAHRFSFQLPSWTQGRGRIHAFGLDYTWYGYTDLTCGSTCAW